MATCEQYQNQLLAYLYDLLEAEERQALQAHMDQCGNCQAALARAKSQQQLLATAAKAEFAAVKFQAPAEIVPVRHEERVLQATRARRPWFGLALAASILVLIGLGASGGWWTVGYVKDKQVVEAKQAEYSLQLALVEKRVQEHDEAVSLAAREVQSLEQQVQKLNLDTAAKWIDLLTKLNNKQFNVVVTGPESVQPGARNEFQIRTSEFGRPVSATVATRVLDENRKTVFEKNDLVGPSGTAAFFLPRDLPVTPQNKLFLEIVAERDGGQKQEIHEVLSLVAPVYLTHLTTDKPMYRPGETVYFRSLTLERYALKPADENLHLVYTVTDGKNAEVFRREGAPQVHDVNNQPIPGPDKKPIRGIGAGEYVIAPGASGGEYTLTVSEQKNRFPPQQRKFIVNQYRNPLMNKELDFTRKSYGTGEEVVAACKVSRVENKDVPIANRPVRATMQIDGKPYGPDGKEGSQPFMGTTDAAGAVNVRFKLPAVMDRGLGTVSVLFSDGANWEALVKPIPIVLKKLDVEFFPEGGDLVAGLPNRVYFSVRSMLGKPAELQGRIVDQDGKVVAANVLTLHDDEKPGVNQGMGLFTFTPEPDKTYELKIDVPSGMVSKHVLPKAVADGVVLSIEDGVTNPKDPIRVTVRSARQDRDLLIGAYCRGRLMDHKTMSARKGAVTAVELKPVQGAGGVYRITVFEEQPGQGNRKQLTPRAERLVYRMPAEQLILNATPDKKQYIPGDKVTLTFSALNEKEQPAPAIAMVAVVDKSVITLADEKTYRTMPTHYYLTKEVRKPEDLEYADFLLSMHPKAAAALDLLLGTQGWRRFAEQDPAGFRKNAGPEAERLLATTGQSPQSNDLLQHQREKLSKDFQTQMTTLGERYAKAMGAGAALQADKSFTEQLANLNQLKARLHQEYEAAVQRLDAHMALAGKARLMLLPAAAVVLFVTTLIFFVAAVRRNSVGHAALFATAAVGVAVSVGLFVFLSGNFSREKDQFALHRAEDARSAAAAPAAVAQPLPAPPAEGKVAELEMRPPKLREAPQAGDNFGRKIPDVPVAKFQAPAGAVAKGEKVAAMRAPLAQKQFNAARNAMPKAVAGQIMPKDMAAKPAAPPAAVPAPLVMKKALQELQEKLAAGKDAEKLEALNQNAEAKKQLPDADKGVAPRMFEHKMPQMQVAKEQAQLHDRKLDDGVQAGAAMRRLRPEARGGLEIGGLRMGGMGGAGGRAFGGFAPLGLEAQKVPNQMMFMHLDAPAPPPFVVREFAYQRSPVGPDQSRSLFADTVYWHPVLVLPDGKGQASFNLSDNVTGYQATVFGHTLDGRIGAVTTLLEARNPLTLEPKLPLEVTAGDTLDVPVSIANNTPDQRPIAMQVTATGLTLAGQNRAQMIIGPNGRERRLFRLRPSLVEGQASVRVEGVSMPFMDSVTRTLSVVPDGFPIVNAKSDVLERVAQHDVVLPEAWLKGTLQCQVQVFPSTLADLQKGLEALLRQPGGCFEQTSSSNYPNVLILNYLKESEQTKPDLERRARDLIASGYNQLVAFECEDPQNPRRRGYEWFGGKAAPHEALTAYGLLEFRDMARVHDVDMKMVERTRQYLMSRKDGKGGFQRNPAAIDTFGRAPDHITNAYIVWALTESGKDDDIDKELAALATQATTSKDPYFIALVANSLINRSKLGEGVALLKALATAQKADGHLDAAQTSITGSGGRDLQIETTALAVLGWLKANRPADFNAPLQKAVKWIGQQRGGYGGFGSTQSTILALKALIAFTNANKKTPEAGELRLFVDEKLVAQKSFAAGVQDAVALEVPEPEKNLKSGKNAVRVEITGKNTFPYTLTTSYRTLKPASAEYLPVLLTAKLDREKASEGESVHLTVTVENSADQGQGMAVTIVGLPSGLTLPEDMKQLKDYALLRNNGKERGLIDAWEIRGRELVLYWRDLAPKQKIEVPLDLMCRVPGEYRGPASRAYLYYNADFKHWVEPLKISIAAKAD